MFHEQENSQRNQILLDRMQPPKEYRPIGTKWKYVQNMLLKAKKK